MKTKRKGYRKIDKEASGSTKDGKAKVVNVYRPKRKVSKTLEKDVTYKTKSTPRKKFTDREVTKRYKDSSLKSHKRIRRKNGKVIKGESTFKEKYKKGNKPFNEI
jgi:hypothetical protein